MSDMSKIRVNLTDPSPKGECVEVETPAGTIRVYCGLVTGPGGKRRVLVEIEEAEGWVTTVKQDGIMGRTEVRQTYA